MTDPSQKSWHVLVQTRNGTVSMIKNLTRAEATQVHNRLDPWKHMQPGIFMRVCQDSDVTLLQIIEPDEPETSQLNDEGKTAA